MGEDWNRIPRKYRIVMAFLAAFTGTLVSSLTAWPFVEPFVVAHRGFVRDYTDIKASDLTRKFAPTRTGLFDIQIRLARSQRSVLSDRIISLEIEAPKSENNTELAARRSQLEKLREEKVEIDDEIKRLLTAREKE